jgi:peptidoglycan hydrolase-like protein with peptidoglycan-binding domain
VDGNFGPLTLAAVRSFQSSHGLAVDGIVGPNTKAALDGVSSGVPAPITPLTSSRCPNYITEGEIDGCVTELQQLLNAHGASLAVDGDFGPLTLAAVESFQSSHGLSVDGIVGPNTKAALGGEGFGVPPAIPITSSSCPTDMTEGEIDGCVTELQILLNDHGAGLAVDGDFGPMTLAAVENYQSTHGLAVDGIVGPNTKASLTGSPGGGSNPPPPSAALLAKIVSYAKAIENGSAEPGWGGGKIQYVWGGGHHSTPGPSTGICAGDPGSLSCTNPNAVGLDCSGFSRWVYDLAYGRDVLGSGNTNNQISEMTRVSSPVAGDLVFFGSSTTNTHHVGVYIGNGQMINEFQTGTVVQTNNVSDVTDLVGYYQYGSGNGGLGESTNYDWARWVLHDGNWPQSSNNITVITRWMTSEEPTSNWFNRDNPLNNGYGCGGGSGLGTCTNLLVAAHYVAENLLLGTADYGAIVSDLAASASPATTAQAIWNSPWASSHYCYGGCWFNGTAATVAAPAADW